MSDLAAGKPHPEIPWDKIREIITNVGADTEIAVRVQRRQPDGSIATESGKRILPASVLLDIEEWLQSRGGGGKYEIWVRDLEMNKLVNFNVQLNAQMTKWADPEWDARREEERRTGYVSKIETLKVGAMKYPLPARFANLMPEQIPPHPRAAGWIATLPTIEQWQVLPDIDSPVAYPTAPAMSVPGAGVTAHPPWGPQVQLPPGASITSDAIAMKQTEDERKEKMRLATENARLQEQLASAHKTHATEIESLRERITQIDRDATQRVHTTEVQTLERKFEALFASLQQPKPQGLLGSNIDPVALATALAPVAIALISRPKPDPMAQLMPLLALTQQKSSGLDDMMKLAPLVVPIIGKYMENRGPEAQAALFETMMSSQQSNVALAAQVVQSLAAQQGGDSPMMQLVQSLLAGGTEMLAQYLEEKKRAAQSQQQPRMTHGRQTMPLPQQTAPAAAAAQQSPAQPAAAPANGGAPQRAGYVTIDDAPAAAAAPNGKSDDAHPSEVVPTSEAVHAQDATTQAPPTAEEVVELFASHPQVPPQFKTMPWRALIYRMHTGEAEDGPEEVAAELLELLDRTEKRSTLPALLSQWRSAPLATFSQLVRFLPVHEFAPDYAEALVQELVKQLGESEQQEEAPAEATAG